jgi:hypothetical protein
VVVAADFSGIYHLAQNLPDWRLAVRITVGSQDEAERIIAAIWVVLERAKIPSPQVRIPRSVLPPVPVELIFEDQNHEDFV